MRLFLKNYFIFWNGSTQHTLFWNGLDTGVYILSQNFIIAPKCDKRMMKIFIIAPNLHFAHNNVLKFAHFVPFVGSV